MLLCNYVSGTSKFINIFYNLILSDIKLQFSSYTDTGGGRSGLENVLASVAPLRHARPRRSPGRGKIIENEHACSAHRRPSRGALHVSSRRFGEIGFITVRLWTFGLRTKVFSPEADS